MNWLLPCSSSSETEAFPNIAIEVYVDIKTDLYLIEQPLFPGNTEQVN